MSSPPAEVVTNPLFMYLANEIRALEAIIVERDLDVRTLHRRLNAVEDLNHELEWRVETLEAFAHTAQHEMPLTTHSIAQRMLADPENMQDPLWELLMEEEEEVDNTDWFDELTNW